MSDDETQQIANAVRALAAGYSFALIRKAGEADTLFVCDDHSGREPLSGTRFVACPWPCTKGVVTVRDMVRGSEIPDCGRLPELPLAAESSTDRGDYLQKVAGLVDELKSTGGKTVISRVINGRADSGNDADSDNGAGNAGDAIARMTQRCFDRYGGQATCCLMYTPQTGCWLMATPELLLHADAGGVSTVALAGTRPSDGDSNRPWDQKNEREQQIVTDHIVGVLRDRGLEPHTGVTHTLTAGPVEHICTPVTAGVTADPLALCMALAPTPAVCGQPTDVSLRRIMAIEQHDRGLYGGFAGITNGASLDAFVVLRCARLADGGRFSIYIGGGITALSDPEAEWNETQAKADTMLELSKCSIN